MKYVLYLAKVSRVQLPLIFCSLIFLGAVPSVFTSRQRTYRCCPARSPGQGRSCYPRSPRISAERFQRTLSQQPRTQRIRGLQTIRKTLQGKVKPKFVIKTENPKLFYFFGQKQKYSKVRNKTYRFRQFSTIFYVNQKNCNKKNYIFVF